MWDPETIANLQVAARANSSDAYRRFAEHANNRTLGIAARYAGLMRFKKGQSHRFRSDEVEPASEIVKRFCDRGDELRLHFHAEAHSTLAIAMNALGGKSNTGEGGEDPERFLPLANGDSRCARRSSRSPPAVSA